MHDTKDKAITNKDMSLWLLMIWWGFVKNKLKKQKDVIYKGFNFIIIYGSDNVLVLLSL